MNKKRFKLIRLLGVLVVLGIILVIAVPTTVRIYNDLKDKEKVKIIEEAAIYFGESNKEEVMKSIFVYKNTSPCKSIRLKDLIPNYLSIETVEKCTGSGSTIGCVVDSGDINEYLYAKEIVLYYKNKRLYAVVDINDELECENSGNELKIKEFYIEDNKEYSTNKETEVYLSWEDDDVAEYCVTNTKESSSCVWHSASGNSATVSHTLTDGDGKKTVYAYLRDEAGNVSEVKEDTIILDTSAPTNNSITINSGASTTSRSVTLTLSSTGASEMCISNTTSCNDDDWVTYATSKSWTLTSGDGEKTVYAWFRDAAGNTSAKVNDKITLDMSAPTSNSIIINSGASSTASRSVTLSLSSSGASEMCISNTTSCSDDDWVTYATSKSWTLASGDGEKTVYAWFRDAAGNTSAKVSDKIILGTRLSDYLLDNEVEGLVKNYVGSDTLYRFTSFIVDATLNNYVCLGTTSKCSSGSDAMYRILGVEPSTGYVKVIKQTPLGSYRWNSVSSSWQDSLLYSEIYDYYSSSSFKNMIVSHSWGIGTLDDDAVIDKETVLLNELKQTINSYVGIISVSDLYFAYANDNNWATTIPLENWLLLFKNADSFTANSEWAMQLYKPGFTRLISFDTGTGYANQTMNFLYARPVFYLSKDVVRVSGSGTESDPFIIR